MVGGVLGHFAFLWIVQQGFYALVLPGGALGIGAGYLIRQRSIPFAVASGIAALALGVFSEWRFAPFIKDSSWGYFLAHVFDLKPITLLMIAAGGAIGFWSPFRATQRESTPRKTAAD